MHTYKKFCVGWTCLLSICVVQGSEEKVLALENKLAELKAENKPLGIVLKQLIQALSAEEVRFV